LSAVGIKNEKQRKRRLIAADAILAAAMTAAAVFEDKLSSLFSACPLYRFTGLRCPSCGGTRAFHELLRLNVPGAVSCNPFLALLGLWCLFVFALYHLKLFAGLRLYDRLSKPVMLCCAGAAALLFFVLRNLPFYPFL